MSKRDTHSPSAPVGGNDRLETTGTLSSEDLSRLLSEEQEPSQFNQVLEQAVLVRAHVESMRANLERSLLHLAEAKKAMAERDLPVPVK